MPPIRRRGQWAWDDRNYVKAYQYASQGMSDKAMASALGVTETTLRKWKEKNEAFREAIEEGRKEVQEESATVTFRDYVYKRLPPDLQDLWDDINACEKRKNGIERIEALLEKRGQKARQHLFLYALTAANFNASLACRKVGISVRTLQLWTRNDPEFARLMDEIHFHKGNFFESALIKKVKQGDTSAVIFANSTFNRDRGYSTKVIHEHKGSVEVTHKHIVDLSKINLPLEVRKQILEAIEAQEKKESEEKGMVTLDYVPSKEG